MFSLYFCVPCIIANISSSFAAKWDLDWSTQVRPFYIHFFLKGLAKDGKDIINSMTEDHFKIWGEIFGRFKVAVFLLKILIQTEMTLVFTNFRQYQIDSGRMAYQ